MSLKYSLPLATRHAQKLRKKCTPAEIKLWDVLRNRKFLSLKFRRQVPLGRFVVDLLCTNPLLIIELDGPIHEYRKKDDAYRAEAIMADFQIPTLRFKNEEVLGDLPKVLKVIEKEVECLRRASPPTPLPRSAW